MKLNLTKDQVSASLKHAGNSAASFVAGAGVAAMTFGYLSQTQLERALKALEDFADGWAKFVPILLLAVPYLAARSASHSASPVEQVRGVEEKIPGVVVTPVTDEGAALLKRAVGVEKPVEVPTVIAPVEKGAVS